MLKNGGKKCNQAIEAKLCKFVSLWVKNCENLCWWIFSWLRRSRRPYFFYVVIIYVRYLSCEFEEYPISSPVWDLAHILYRKLRKTSVYDYWESIINLLPQMFQSISFFNLNLKIPQTLSWYILNDESGNLINFIHFGTQLRFEQLEHIFRTRFFFIFQKIWKIL